jgi:hypothetical protein
MLTATATTATRVITPRLPPGAPMRREIKSSIGNFATPAKVAKKIATFVWIELPVWKR